MAHRVVILARSERPQVAEVLQQVRRVISNHAEIAGELEANGDPLPDDLDVDIALAIGGDGTLITQATRLVDRQIPLIGVNVGKLGFLAEFSPRSLEQHARVIFSDNPPIREHMLLHTTVHNADGSVKHKGLAMNDTVITAGPPYHMIELQLKIDGSTGPILSGDGVIVASPTGSTAYNASAGGPIVHPQVRAMVITPLAAHSLAFRPLVLAAECRLEIIVNDANEGTSVIQDGRRPVGLTAGDRVLLQQHEKPAQFVLNPAATYWHILLDKLRWAAPPNYER